VGHPVYLKSPFKKGGVELDPGCARRRLCSKRSGDWLSEGLSTRGVILGRLEHLLQDLNRSANPQQSFTQSGLLEVQIQQFVLSRLELCFELLHSTGKFVAHDPFAFRIRVGAQL
jgi:hypothetical protein